MYNFIKNTINNIFNYLLPPTCINCSQIVSENGTLCHECFAKINFIEQPLCQICGSPFELETQEENEQNICAKCLINRPYYDKSRSVVIYDEHSKNMILSLKYKDRTDVAPYFANWLMRAGQEIFKEKIDYIIPVPLHKFRLLKRKFNQSSLLSNEIHKKHNIKKCYNNLIRTKNTQPQSSLGKKQRKTNIKGVFKIKKPQQIKNKSILLIDDIMTTGATINECSKVLKKAGVAKIFVLTIAKTT